MISAIVLTKNEEKNIVDCLELLLWCDEIIVVDDNSEDRTVDLAKRIGAKVFEHNLDNDFSRQRNYGLEKAKGDWVLFIDADERISEALASEISNIICQPTDQISNKYDGYYIKRIDFMWGRKLKYGETGDIKLLRLARKNKGMWEGKVHEKWKVSGSIGELKNPILHYPHQTISEFLKEINFYTSLRAEELSKKEIYWVSIIFYPFGKFVLNYFIKRGFLDGIKGLIFAITMSFHSFLVRGKLWLLNRKDE